MDIVPVRMILASSTAAIWPPPTPDAGSGFAGGAPSAPPLSPLPPPLPTASPPAWAAGADAAAIPRRRRSAPRSRSGTGMNGWCACWTSEARRGLDGRGGIRLTPRRDGGFPVAGCHARRPPHRVRPSRPEPDRRPRPARAGRKEDGPLDRSVARRLLAAGLLIGVLAEVVLDGPAYGLNVLIVVAALLGAGWLLRRRDVLLIRSTPGCRSRRSPSRPSSPSAATRSWHWSTRWERLPSRARPWSPSPGCPSPAGRHRSWLSWPR